MSRSMIEIVPDTESWDAWIEYHRGSKTELVMVRCRQGARPFMAWSEFPPERARADGLSQAPKVEAPVIERSFNVERDVGEIAERLEAKAGRDAVEADAADERADELRTERIAFDRALDAVRSGQTPKLKDLPDVGFVMIADPMEVQQPRKAPKLRAKLVNLRDDPVGQMAKRGQIEPDQLDAARRWQALFDVAASVGGSRGIDPGAMKVDGGKFGEPITDAQMYAMRQLQDLDRVLGLVGASIVRHVLGDRMTVSQVAAMSGSNSALGLKHTGHRLRECLDTLVAVLGVETKGRGKRQRPDEATELARFADNPLLYRAVHEARRKIV